MAELIPMPTPAHYLSCVFPPEINTPPKNPTRVPFFARFNFLVLLVFGSLAVGALLRTVMKGTKIPILVVMLLIGIITGVATQIPLVMNIAKIEPVLFKHMFTPIIVLTAGLQMDFYIFKKAFWQVFILAFVGCMMTSTFLGWIVYKVNKYNWNWNESMLFAITLSTTDPVLSVVPVKNIGLSKIIINMIQGEAMLNDASASVFFEFYRDTADQNHYDTIEEFLAKLLLKFVGSAAFGLVWSKIVRYCLTKVFNDGITEIALTFSMAYVIFFLAEWLGMSGVISLFVVGLLLDSVRFSKGTDVTLYEFCSLLTFWAHSMIYLITGIVMAEKTFPHITSRDIFYIIMLYLSLHLVRGLVILILSPALTRLGYGYNWRWGAIAIWSGMRGTFTLNLALEISQSGAVNIAQPHIRIMMLLHSITASLLTLMINSTTVKKLAITLGLCNVTLPKRMALHNALERIKQVETNALNMLKHDKFLAGANWKIAEETLLVESPDKVTLDEVKQLSQTVKCPDCNAHVSFMGNTQQIADILEEARLRLLTAQIASYQKQYTNGMLSQEATQILIGAAACYADVEGRFMNIHEVKTYWESKGLVMRLKKFLSNWVYNVKDDTSSLPRNRLLKLCHQIVFVEEFEYVSTLITYLNCTPVVLHFIPAINEEFLPQLRLSNYFFLTFYIIEAFLKILAMGKYYIYYHWNQFDLLVIIVGIADVVVINLIKTVDSYAVFHTIRTFRFIRVLRLFRLLKRVIPKMIIVLKSQINKELTFRFDITKGYVQSEEDVKCLMGQIAGNERVYKEIKKIVEKNMQEAMKELGLMQRDYPDIVTSVKTKQLVQTVLNTASEALTNMVSGGIVDKAESAEVHKMLLLKKKKLATIPSLIPPPSIPEILQNVMWLQGYKDRIAYIQEKAQIHYYNYGDFISDEGDLPKGIHIIISGMVKLCGSPPRYGVDIRESQKHPPAAPYTDYMVAGTIIGEVNCITNQAMEYEVTCETAVQTCFIDIDDLLEAFDMFLDQPCLEDKIWLKIGLDVAVKIFTKTFTNQDWQYKMCSQHSNIRIVDVERFAKHNIYSNIMDVLLVHGSVQDCQGGQRYLAPCILPQTCRQVQGTAVTSKLLVINTKEESATAKRETCRCHLNQRRETGGNVFAGPGTPDSVTIDID